MKRLMTYIFFTLFVMMLATFACIASINFDTGSNIATSSNREQATQSAAATATFGAEQFHLQLTAIASEDQ